MECRRERCAGTVHLSLYKRRDNYAAAVQHLLGPNHALFCPFVRGICGWVEFRWHDKCLIGMEFPNAEPPSLCSIFHSSFECGPDGRAPSILRSCHGHVTLLPSIPGRALDQNHHQPRPTKTNLNQNQTKTI